MPESPESEKSKRASSKASRWSWPEAPKRATGMVLNLSQIERRFGIGEYWIYRWVEQGRLHAVLVGRRWHYPEWEVRELAKTIPPESGGEPPFDGDKSHSTEPRAA